MLYHSHPHTYYVMQRIGLKNIKNTLLCTQLVTFENDHYYSATAKDVEDVQKLVEAGFEYVCDVNDVKVFRKPK